MHEQYTNGIVTWNTYRKYYWVRKSDASSVVVHGAPPPPPLSVGRNRQRTSYHSHFCGGRGGRQNDIGSLGSHRFGPEGGIGTPFGSRPIIRSRSDVDELDGGIGTLNASRPIIILFSSVMVSAPNPKIKRACKRIAQNNTRLKIFMIKIILLLFLF